MSIVEPSVTNDWKQGFLSIVVPMTFPSISILERYFLGSRCLQTWLSQTFCCMPRKEPIELLRAPNPAWNSSVSSLNEYEEYLWNSSIWPFSIPFLDKTLIFQISGYGFPLVSPVLSEHRFGRTKGENWIFYHNCVFIGLWRLQNTNTKVFHSQSSWNFGCHRTLKMP